MFARPDAPPPNLLRISSAMTDEHLMMECPDLVRFLLVWALKELTADLQYPSE